MSAMTEPQEGVPIASVEQATGIARATLRIWERRYGFPQPGRDLRGERSYPDDQVRKLRLIADLMNQGHRPGRLVQLTLPQLESLAGPAGDRGGERPLSVDQPVIAALRAHDVATVRRLLEEGIRQKGLAGFVTEQMARLNVDVGIAWARGEVEVFEEHLYSECVQQVVRTHLARVAEPVAPGPRVLLATFPEEGHGLGLLMAQVLLALEGCPCTSLGVRVPLQQIVAASKAFHADVVGLSFTPSMNPAHVLRGLEQLRGELAPQVAVWAGGRSPVLARHRIAGVQPIPNISELPALVAQWRAVRAPVPSALPSGA
ncbi:cobalamin B12-binding domain-containing protein [Ramlibacter sp. USB13]|uniref:Cobalamin B12-binding domain-containing protein n=1 Tax=Ramlibacter cellulosilyticus TaxID=2764187 RepID=A0A923MRB7_9BURK|nr:cobalamin-dependent protein [Ramlibacter cellulosilyticus]MBC5782407.1 cobalamin B12-binding domain-containing protein [Ramlibacter cellulosilyticus]